MVLASATMPDFTATIRCVDPEYPRKSLERPFLASYVHPCGLVVTEFCATRDGAWEWLRLYDEQVQIKEKAAAYLRVHKDDLFYASRLLDNNSPPPDFRLLISGRPQRTSSGRPCAALCYEATR